MRYRVTVTYNLFTFMFLAGVIDLFLGIGSGDNRLVLTAFFWFLLIRLWSVPAETVQEGGEA